MRNTNNLILKHYLAMILTLGVEENKNSFRRHK